MKALTIWQPWATLIAVGAKQYETRSWATDYRGPLVIHAAKRGTELMALADIARRITAGESYLRYNAFVRHALAAFEADGPCDFMSLPLGAALCVVDLVDVIEVDEALGERISAREAAFGDYSNGRYAWKLDNIRHFDKPIPYKDAQGLWHWRGPLP